MKTTTLEKPFKVAFLVRQKNGVLWEAMKERGWSQSKTAEFLGLTATEFGKILNFKKRLPTYEKLPVKRRETRRKELEEKLMELTGKKIEELFPEEVYNDKVMAEAKPLELVIERDISQLSLTSSESLMIEDSRDAIDFPIILDAVKSVVTEDEWKVFEEHLMDEHSFSEVGKGVLSASGKRSLKHPRDRARLIEKRALQKIRGNPGLMALLRGDEICIPQH